MNYEESVAYMSGLLQFGMRLDRERFAALLARLGDPHQELRCVHVAGTNGKGSTTTFIAAILRAGGYRVGTYLSPYVFDLRERVQLNGEMISPDDFAHWVSVIRPHIEAVAETELGQTTEFELKTAVAFCFFAAQAVDFAVIEVGIGGRLDATNVIPPPLVSVITSIGLDHTGILGDTLAKIAGEKAGIIKNGTLACVTAVAPGEALDVITRIAAERNVPLRRAAPLRFAEGSPITYDVDARDGTIFIVTPFGDYANLRLALRGPFQAANAAAAAGAVAVLQENGLVPLLSPAAVRAGLETATLPGRFQIVQNGNPALILDGAHNEDGARVLRESLQAVFTGKRIVLVMGTRSNHAPEPFLKTLTQGLSVVRFIATAPSFKPTPAAHIAEAARVLVGIEAEIIEPAGRAIATAWQDARPGEVVLVTGSFYVVGETPDDLRTKTG